MTPGPAPPLRLQYEPLVRRGLEEDLGAAGDLTTDAVVPPDLQATGVIVAGAAGRLAGLGVAACAFTLLDPAVQVHRFVHDGADVGPGQRLGVVQGPARALLGAERTALNLLGRLCGIATTTRDVVTAVVGHPARVVPTRKTTPGLRAVERYAVRVGGGAEHRFGLDDAVLIKDNHRVLAGGLTEAVSRVRQRIGHLVKVEVEVDTLEQLDEALGLGVDAVLLDNMGLEELRRAVGAARGKTVTEASGGISPETAPAVAATGVDLLSIGWITHSAPALDVGLDLEPQAGLC
ncbi:MAG: carboxylating nicotinate-nucleotide diphosphorylase [Actinomycetota bacterium]|nr:carboxylating nicotinate-nucleotide diphosphorylase [Actinomycetota bacterium]